MFCSQVRYILYQLTSIFDTVLRSNRSQRKEDGTLELLALIQFAWSSVPGRPGFSVSSSSRQIDGRSISSSIARAALASRLSASTFSRSLMDRSLSSLRVVALISRISSNDRTGSLHWTAHVDRLSTYRGPSLRQSKTDTSCPQSTRD